MAPADAEHPEDALTRALRGAGYSGRAKDHPLEGARLVAFAAWCGVPSERLPEAYRYAANATSVATLDRVVAAAGSGGDAHALYLAARKGAPGEPDENTLAAYGRVARAVREALHGTGTERPTMTFKDKIGTKAAYRAKMLLEVHAGTSFGAAQHPIFARNFRAAYEDSLYDVVDLAVRDLDPGAKVLPAYATSDVWERQAGDGELDAIIWSILSAIPEGERLDGIALERAEASVALQLAQAWTAEADAVGPRFAAIKAAKAGA